MQPGDVVLIRDKKVPRHSWPMGRIEVPKVSDDGLVRSATVRLAPLPGSTKARLIDRAVSDMVLLVPSEGHGI